MSDHGAARPSTVVRVARPAVLARVPRSGHLVLEAAAGTGKTFTLEHLVVDLLLVARLPIERILLVTFTEKATEELRLRLRALLQRLADVGEDASGDPAAAAPAGADPSADGWEIDEEARERLRDAVVRFDAATIATLHGFCQRILAEHAFAHRQLFAQRLIDGREAFARGFRDTLRHALAPDHPRRRALAAYLRGGGSLDRLERLVYDASRQRAELTPRWDPQGLAAAASALALLWSRPLAVRALGAAGVRLTADLAGRCDEPGELAARLLAGGDPGAFAEGLAEWGGQTHSVKKRSASRWQYLLAGLEALAADSRDGAAAAELRRVLQSLAELAAPPLAGLVAGLRDEIGERLAAVKRSQGLYDFDDMLLHVRDSLRGPQGEALAATLRERFAVALIDEFQDTDEVQWEIFRTLFFTAGPEHRLILVGDPKQAIYGFRSADVQAYFAAREAVLAGGGAVVPLLANYRSTPALIGACNRLFGRGWFTGALADPPPVEPGDPSLRLGDATGAELAPVVVWQLRRAQGRLRGDEALAALGRRIAVEAHRLVTGGVRFGRAGEEAPLRWADLQVLTRRRSDAEIVAAALREAGVPHVLFGQEGLLATPEAEHLRRLLLALATPRDLATRLQAWLTPFFAVPLAELARCRELPEDHPLVARLLAWAELATSGRFALLFRRVLRESGLVRRLLATRQGERELTNYQHVIDLLVDEAQRAPLTVDELAARLGELIEGRRATPETDGDVQRLEPERDAVQLLTMHRAKGLQAAVVFLAGGFGDYRGRDPLRVYHRGHRRMAHLGPALGEIEAAIQREALEESQRLLYVALTRARGRLYLPSLPGNHERSQAPYAVVERRLEELLGSGVPPPGFVVETYDVDAPPVVAAAPAAPPTLAPAVAAAAREDPAQAAGDYARLRRRHAGRLLTSYTRIRRAAATAPAAWRPGEEDPPAQSVPGEGELPGGRATGILLHRLLEELDPQVVAAASAFEAWEALPAVAATCRRVAGEEGFPLVALPAARQLVWRALRTPLDLPGLRLPAGLCAPTPRSVELELLYPIPESWHPRLGAPPVTTGEALDERPFRAGRGYVQGVVDLVFSLDGKSWLVDWKSDRLPAYDAASVATHVAAHYALQARLYALGVLRLLSLAGDDDPAARFGGLLYCFLRGMGGDDGAGVWCARPGASELRSWEEELQARREWGRAEGPP